MSNNFPIKIIFQDENILIIDKPAGLVVHNDYHTQEISLSDILLESFPNLKDIGNPHTLDNERYVPRFGMISRLDRGTRGILIIAKNQETFEFFQDLQKNQKIEKEYFAVLYGNLSNSLQSLIAEEKVFKEGELYKIKAPIGRNKIDPRKWTSKEFEIRNTKRDAETLFKIEKQDENLTYLKIFLKTGRTHQIRVHFDYLGFPLFGDNLYGNNAELNKIQNKKIELISNSISFFDKENNFRKFSI
jgi:23S rRNA pseudouridine1911/1915/1917 synthase